MAFQGSRAWAFLAYKDDIYTSISVQKSVENPKFPRCRRVLNVWLFCVDLVHWHYCGAARLRDHVILQLPPHALCPAGQTPISRSHTLGHTPKISRFHHEDFKISPKISRRFQDFTFHKDFKISQRFQDFSEDFKEDFKISVEISAVVYEISASGGPGRVHCSLISCC